MRNFCRSQRSRMLKLTIPTQAMRTGSSRRSQSVSVVSSLSEWRRRETVGGAECGGKGQERADREDGARMTSREAPYAQFEPESASHRLTP